MGWKLARALTFVSLWPHTGDEGDAERQFVRLHRGGPGGARARPGETAGFVPCSRRERVSSTLAPCMPVQSDIFEWHFVIRGPPETEFEVRKLCMFAWL